MTAFRSFAVALAVSASLCPSVAHAAVDVDAEGRWIDRLSGPGPFRAVGLNLMITCAKDSSKRVPGQPYTVEHLGACDDRDSMIRHLVEVRGRYLWTYGGPLFIDTPSDTRSVKGLMVDALAIARLNPIVDVGAGIGFVSFWGDGFDTQSRLTLIPVSVSVTPLAIGLPSDFQGSVSRWRRLLSLRYELMAIAPGFSGTDFGNTATAYSTKREYVSSVGIGLDFSF